MPIVVNSNASATSASLNLSRANFSLRSSLERLSSGKKINRANDDAGGVAVTYKLESEGKRTKATVQNVQNALSYLQARDGSMVTAGNIFNRISQMRVMAEDVTKKSGDIENYSKEFVELQLQLDQINNQKFNALSLFAMNGAPPSNNGTKGIVTYQKTDGTPGTYQKFGRVLQVDPTSSGETVSINVINLEYVVSYDALDPTKVQVNAAGYADRITDFSVSPMMEVIEKIPDVGVLWFEAPTWKQHMIDDSINSTHSTDFGDIDGDGDVDMSTVGYESKLAVWYENDGKGNFTRHVLSRDQMAYDTMITDLDGDGDKDILVAGQRSQNVVWFENPKR